MPTYTFVANNSAAYWGTFDGARFSGGAIQQGHQPDDTNIRSLVLFDASDIRTKLTGLTVTSCKMNFYVSNLGGSSATMRFGTHNYTSVPGAIPTGIGAYFHYSSGNFAYFDSDDITIRPEHIMASGALPPGLPPVMTAGEASVDTPRVRGK